MRVTVLVAILGALIGSTACVAGTRAAEPRLGILDRSPLTLQGVGFRPHEKVFVIARGPAVNERRTVRADFRGRFRTTIDRLSLTGRLRCAVGLVIVARSVAGALVLWRPELPDCPAPLRPPA